MVNLWFWKVPELEATSFGHGRIFTIDLDPGNQREEWRGRLIVDWLEMSWYCILLVVTSFTWLVNLARKIMYLPTLQTNLAPPPRKILEDYFPVPWLGYVTSLECRRTIQESMQNDRSLGTPWSLIEGQVVVPAQTPEAFCYTLVSQCSSISILGPLGSIAS